MLQLQSSSAFAVVSEQSSLFLHSSYDSALLAGAARLATSRSLIGGTTAIPTTTTSTACHLFFRKTQQEAERTDLRRICEELTTSSSLCLPYEAILAPQRPSETNERWTIRVVQPRDLPIVAEMCVQEYDSGPNTFPFHNPKLIPAWLDRQALYNLVYWTTFVKLLQQQQQQPNRQQCSGVPNDHAVLHELKVGNPHYVTLADRYHDVNDEIHRIDAGIETPSDDYAETLKKKRLALIDEIAGLVAKAKSG